MLRSNSKTNRTFVAFVSIKLSLQQVCKFVKLLTAQKATEATTEALIAGPIGNYVAYCLLGSVALE